MLAISKKDKTKQNKYNKRSSSQGRYLTVMILRLINLADRSISNYTIKLEYTLIMHHVQTGYDYNLQIDIR